jgi:hypothetical protein
VSSAQWIIILAGGSLALGILAHRLNTRRLLARYGSEFHAYNAAAFGEVIEPSPHEHFNYVTRLASELESKKGQRAISVLTLGPGTAIQHINRDGTFSAKGPYFISWRTQNWRHTGKRHLVKVLRGKGGFGFKPDHYKQDGIIREKGVAIVEYGTAHYPPLSIRDYVANRRRDG